MYRGAPIIIR